MRSFLLVALSGVLLSSCFTQRKAESNHNYLEDVKDTSFKKNVFSAEPIIQKSDLLSIQVYSAATDPNVDRLYNLPVLNSGGGASSGQGQLSGFLVDQQGNIEYPRIGVIHAEGLTKAELADVIKTKLSRELTNPSVIIRFLNFRVSVLGEVGSQGVLNIPSERVNILEAIALAGGVTDYGKIKEVKVWRETNGVRQFGVVDLTSKELFASPYYQLQQNDVVLVDKTRYKLRQTEQTRISQQLGFALSIITSIALLYNIFK
jgi:polysaccharide export outer membrane protein